MATLSANDPREFESGDYNTVGVVASDILYEGSLIGDNGSGYGRPLVAGDRPLGWVDGRSGKVDNSSGSAGDLDVDLLYRGKVKLSVASVAITDVGKPVYASDDDTFVLTDTGSLVGFVHRFVSSGVAVVAFDYSKNYPAERQVLSGATMTVGAEATNVINVAIQLEDQHGADMAEAVSLLAYLAGDANGQTIASAHTSSPAIGTDGLIQPLQTDLTFLLTSESDGDIDIDFTDTGASTVYLVLVMPDGRLVISDAITHAA